jgi:hypothetical protein
MHFGRLDIGVEWHCIALDASDLGTASLPVVVVRPCAAGPLMKGHDVMLAVLGVSIPGPILASPHINPDASENADICWLLVGGRARCVSFQAADCVKSNTRITATSGVGARGRSSPCTRL